MSTGFQIPSSSTFPQLQFSVLVSSGCVLLHSGCYLKKKYHRLFGLNNRTLFSEFLRLESPRSRSGRLWLLGNAFLTSTGATFSLCPHIVFPWYVFIERERETDLSFLLLIRPPILLVQNHNLMTLFNPSCLLKAKSQSTFTPRVRDSVCGF